MSERNMNEDDPLDDFAHREIELDGVTKTVHVAGSGPAVIVMTEMPGISPHVARFSRWVRDAGFTVYMPSLFGRDGAVVSAEGGQRFDALEPGSYVLNLMITSRGSRSSAPVAWLPVDLGPGENEARLAIPPLFTLDVVVPETKEGARVQVAREVEGDQRTSRTAASERCDADGRVHFEDLPAGRYRVSTWGGKSRGHMIVDVPSGEVVFEPERN